MKRPQHLQGHRPLEPMLLQRRIVMAIRQALSQEEWTAADHLLTALEVLCEHGGSDSIVDEVYLLMARCPAQRKH